VKITWQKQACIKIKNPTLRNNILQELGNIMYDKDGSWRTPKIGVEPTWGSNYVELRKIGTWGALPTSSTKKGVEGRARSPEIRLGRWTRRSSLNLHPKPTTKGLVSIREHPWVLGQATNTFTHKTHHGLNSGEATTFSHIVFSAALHGTCIQMALFPKTPKLESRNCPGLESQNFGSSYLPTVESNQDEV
jgi:hypothetical protein